MPMRNVKHAQENTDTHFYTHNTHTDRQRCPYRKPAAYLILRILFNCMRAQHSAIWVESNHILNQNEVEFRTEKRSILFDLWFCVCFCFNSNADRRFNVLTLPFFHTGRWNGQKKIKLRRISLLTVVQFDEFYTAKVAHAKVSLDKQRVGLIEAFK